MEYPTENIIPVTPPTDLNQNAQVIPQKSNKTKYIWIILFSILILFSVSGTLYFILGNKINKQRSDTSNISASPTNKPIVNEFVNDVATESKLILKSSSRNNFSETVFSENLNGYLLLYTEDKKACKLITPLLTKEYSCSEIGLQHKLVSDTGQSAYELPANKYLDKSLIYNGNELGIYRDVQIMAFSPSGKDFAFIAFVVPGEKNVLYLNGSEVNTDNCKGLVNFYFKPRSQSMDYLCVEEDTKYVIFNGKKQVLSTQKNISIPNSIYRSKDGSRFAYIKMYYDQTSRDSSAPFIPDMYATDYTITLDGKESKKYKIIHDVTFSPDNNHFAYVGMTRDNNSKMTSELVVDNKIVATKPNESSIELERDIANVIFSPDSNIVAYTKISDEGLDELFLNNTSIGKFVTASNLTYSPDGRHYVFTAKNSDTSQKSIFPVLESEIEAEKNPNPDKLIIVDGKTFKTAGVVSPIKFSNDSNNIIYYGFVGTDLWLNVDKLNH